MAYENSTNKWRRKYRDADYSILDVLRKGGVGIAKTFLVRFSPHEIFSTSKSSSGVMYKLEKNKTYRAFPEAEWHGWVPFLFLTSFCFVLRSTVFLNGAMTNFKRQVVIRKS